MAKKTKTMPTDIEAVEDQTTADASGGDEDFLFGEGAEYLTPPTDLRAKAPQRPSKQGDRDPVEAAEAALKRMETSFDSWMTEETVRLVTLWNEAEATGYEGEAREAFHRAAHDIKGQAATLGFPLAGRVAGSLCRILEAMGAERMPHELVRQHVQSVRAMIVEQARDEGSPTAVRLADRLEEVTIDFLDRVGCAA